MEVLIALSIVSIIISVIIVNSVNKRNMNTTKQYSALIVFITKLNNRYEFHKISGTVIKFNPRLKSKKSLENLNLYQYVADEIANNQSYYSSLFNKINENIRNYKSYQSEYKSIEKYTTEEEFNKFNGIKLKYKTFLNCEKKFYQSMKLQAPVMSVRADCHATYTSPSGRNHYWRDESYSFYQLERMLKYVEQEQERIQQEKERKEKLAEEKRAKEKRLRELDKLESRLAQKEKEINEKEKEFLEATKEHIYTAEKIEVNNKEIKIDENLSLSQKLKLLKEKYDNGEITYEEYQLKRKELM